MLAEIPICTACKWIGTNGSGNSAAFRCFAERNKQGSDPVIGGPRYFYPTCYEARAASISTSEPNRPGCGYEGVWFEPAPPKPARIEVPPIPPIRQRPREIDTDALLAQLGKPGDSLESL